MAYCETQNPPVFEQQIEKWDKTTRDNGEELAIPIEKLFNNTVYNKAEIERLQGKLLKNIIINVSAWKDLTYTISDSVIKASSSVTVIYNFDSILIAQKANIRGKTESGKLVLVAKKLPVSNLVIDEIRIVNFN